MVSICMKIYVYICMKRNLCNLQPSIKHDSGYSYFYAKYARRGFISSMCITNS